jgi:hypothetical protein
MATLAARAGSLGGRDASADQVHRGGCGWTRVERVEAWRTGLALPHADLEPSGRPFIGLTIRTGTEEPFFPFSIEAARMLAEELDALCREAEAQSN